MGYLRGKIRSNHIDTQALIVNAYYRSLLTYFMVPLYAAGAITEQEINNLESNILRSQFGWKGDISNNSLQKIVAFNTTTIGAIVAKIGSKLRNNIKEVSRAKAKKGFVDTVEITEQQKLERASLKEKAGLNMRASRIKLSEIRLILALERKRTTDTYGTHHYCKTHK